MFALKHQLFDFLRIFGVRDRLRCPNCFKIGTWKPHGGWLDSEDECPVRRWLCKWCGYYQSAQRFDWCEVGDTCWEFAKWPETVWPVTRRRTPENLLIEHQIDPWRG